MEKKITMRGMEANSLVEEHIHAQLEKFDKFLDQEKTPCMVDVVLDAMRDHHHHRVEIRLKSPDYDLVTHYECQDMYEAINGAVEKMKNELAKSHARNVNERKRGKY